jgi:VanZ family protein
MPDPQPASPDAQTRPGGSRVPAWLQAWWPALTWAAVIFLLSTDTFSAHHTAGLIEPVIHWLFPSFSEDQIELAHHIIRKIAHFTEYFVFGLFLYRAVRGQQKGWRWNWGLTAWFIAACYSALDEIHQAFVSSRTASPYDSLIDSVGALVAMLFLYFWFLYRSSRLDPAGTPETAPTP